MTASARRRAGVAAFRAGWALARAVPEPVADLAADAVARLAHRRGGPRVRQLRATLARVRPGAGPAELDALVGAGLRSYARYWSDVLRLPAWSAQRVVSRVRFVDEGGPQHGMRAALARGGAVGFLGHLGNWDHGAAWSAHDFGRVVTVAERLDPVEVFDLFVAFRRSLGTEVVPLGDPAALRTLVRAAREGAVVPLLADRDLVGTGVGVDFLGERVTMAAGPAVVALAAGVPLHPMLLHHEGPRRRTLVVRAAPAVDVPPRGAGESARAHRERAVAAMTQACADALAEAVRAHPEEWHVLQPFFSADLPAADRPAPPAPGGAP